MVVEYVRKVVNRMIYKANLEIMSAYLRGRLDAPGFKQSQKALAFAWEAHAGKKRESGEPYIIHPLQMACDAIACKGATDRIIATLLLHDTVEDCNIPLSALPVDETVRRAVKLLTIHPLHGEAKIETKRRYYNELLDSGEATVGKAFDRLNNLHSMEGVFEEDRIVKNIRETHELLMPILKRAKYIYPELSDMLHTVKTELKWTIELMALYHKVEFE